MYSATRWEVLPNRQLKRKKGIHEFLLSRGGDAYNDIDLIATGIDLSPENVEKDILAIMESFYGETRMERRDIYIIGTTEKRSLVQFFSQYDTVVVHVTVGKTLEEAVMRKEYLRYHWFHEIV